MANSSDESKECSSRAVKARGKFGGIELLLKLKRARVLWDAGAHRVIVTGRSSVQLKRLRLVRNSFMKMPFGSSVDLKLLN